MYEIRSINKKNNLHGQERKTQYKNESSSTIILGTDFIHHNAEAAARYAIIIFSLQVLVLVFAVKHILWFFKFYQLSSKTLIDNWKFRLFIRINILILILKKQYPYLTNIKIVLL